MRAKCCRLLGSTSARSEDKARYIRPICSNAWSSYRSSVIIAGSENIAAEVFVFDDVFKFGAHVVGIHAHGFLRHVGCLEGDVFEQPLQHGMQSPGADVLATPVDLGGHAGKLGDGVVPEFDGHALGGHQGHVLASQGVARLREDALEVLFGQVLQLDADGQAALQFGDKVGRLGDVESARGDEKDVVGADRAIFRGDGRTLDDRQDVALHALARYVRSAAGGRPAGRPGDLIYLVHADDAALLGAVNGVAHQGVTIYQALGLFLGKDLLRLGDGHLALLVLLGQEAPQRLHVHAHLLDALRREDLHERHALRLFDHDLDLLAVPSAGSHLLADALPD